MDGGDRWHVPTRSRHRASLDSVVALRFRPIAPKPVAGGHFPGVSSPPETAKRAKRKYVRARSDGINPIRKRTEQGKKSDRGETETIPPPEIGSRTDKVAAAESWVTVEHVTDTCMAGELGLQVCTDAERVMGLEGDTCPGFISDECMSRVEWVNEAYRKMVAAAEVIVRLSTAAPPRDGVASFTCRVRVQYSMRNDDSNENKKDNNKCWKVMPCDVWRLNSGGFAWRLDLNAALSLGL